MPELEEKLQAGISALHLSLPDQAQQKLLAYLYQLHKWNQAYNLSGIKNIEEMLTLHILDSLAMAPYIDGQDIADVGTGAGLPGVPLAICFPEKKFTLIDSNSKKTRFIFQTASLLELPNVHVVHKRVGDYDCHQQLDIVTSRAFSSLNDFVTSSQHMLREQGRFLAMKGLVPQEEITDLPTEFCVFAIHPLNVPGTQANRHVIDIRRKS
ncbi:MAG: 16S rRNA (guanine(527)-N(7))-methyltransferase RsmG [Pseudomonadota bacterium]